MHRDYLRLIVFVIGCMMSMQTRAQISFVDVTDQAAIDHRFEVFEATFGGGAAVIDYNQDGFEDVLMMGGAAPNQLLRNNGDGTFVDVAEEVGLSVLNDYVTQGVVTADVNKDGITDVFITTIVNVVDGSFKKARNFLLVGQQDGHFVDRSAQFGIASAEAFSTAAMFGDFNKDGYPDLYVGNYFDDYTGSLDKFSGPQLDNAGGPAADFLYLNQGGEKFIEVSTLVGMDHTGFSFGGVWTDFDEDNDLDLMIVNDFGFRATPNLLYRNDYPRMSFTEIGEEMGFNFGINAMGVAVGDCNLDGHLDYLVTNLQASPLFINRGPGKSFRESSSGYQTQFQSLRTNEGYRVTPVSWGVNFFDADHDMDLDLYMTNGALNPGLPPNPNLFFTYQDDGFFLENSKALHINDHSIGRGSVNFDYDNDGDMDLLVVNQAAFQGYGTEFDNKSSRLYENTSIHDNNWLKVKLEGVVSESRGIGSKLKLYVDNKVLVREIDGGSSHESQNSTIAHFGLGKNTIVDSLVIEWSAGTHQMLSDIQLNRLLTVRELESESGLLDASSLTILPNPLTTSAFIQFQLSQSIDWSLDIFTPLGAHAMHLTSGQGRTGFHFLTDVSSLSPGVYFLSITTATGITSKKILVH